MSAEQTVIESFGFESSDEDPWEKKQWLYDQYWGKQKSIDDIAKLTPVSRDKIYYNMTKLGIPTQGYSHSRSAYLYHQRVSREDLFDLYWREDMTMAEIAKIYSVTNNTVSRKLKSVTPPIKKKPHGYAHEGKEVASGYDNHLAKKHPTVRHSRGYIYWYVGFGAENKEQVLEHRLTAIGEWGLDAVKGKHVHHANGVKWLNVPKFDMDIPELENPNLVPVDPVTHAKL